MYLVDLRYFAKDSTTRPRPYQDIIVLNYEPILSKVTVAGAHAAVFFTPSKVPYPGNLNHET